MAENEGQRKLGQMLVNRGIITNEQLEEAVAEQLLSGRFIGEILVNRGAAKDEDVARILSEQTGFAYLDLATTIIEPKAVEAIPEEAAVRHKAMPLYITQNTLTVAMANPLDVHTVDELQSAANMRIKPVFASYSAITEAQARHYGTQSQAPGADKAGGGKGESDPASLEQAANLASVIDTVNSIIEKAVDMGASDIHLEPERQKLNCRYRVDGLLYQISELAPDLQAAVISRIKIMANMDIAEKRLPQDGRIRLFAANRDVDLRVSSFPTIHGENIVIRILDRSAGILKLSQLGFSKDNLKNFRELISRPYGIILVTGPTGSGKTTTLYGALSELNSEEKNIITLEDPVEYEIPNVRQSQVNVKAGLTFASGLRSIVRQDPDIILIGEIRDKETADISIHAALTGHLVLSTLHTNDAPSAATRLIDMGVEPFLVSSSIIGILAQRLVRTLCDQCREAYKPPRELIEQLGLPAPGVKEPYKFYRPVGCKKCKKRGYAGRSGIYELLIPDDNVKALIARKASATVIREEAAKHGMKALRDSGLEKVIGGITSVAEVLRVTEET